MAAKLVAEEGILKGLVLSMEDGDQWVIGRDPDACQLLVEDPSTSRKHLVCRTTPKGILLENLSETNPTRVNEVEVKEPRLLHNGDAVKIGDGTFRFYTGETAPAAEETSLNGKLNELAGNGLLAEDHPVFSEQKATEIEPEIEMDIGSPPQEGSENLIASEDNAQENEVGLPGDNAELSKQENQEPRESSMDLSTENEEMKSQSTQNDFPHDTASPEDISDDGEQRHDSIFDEEPSDKHSFPEINFGLLDTGRWLLKVINGPNNGAEFSMQSGNSYIIGTDPNACDIVFHDTSVSRQHARITVNPDDSLVIEDLKSRNGTSIDGEPLQGQGKRPLTPNALVTVGTTSFVVFDREGEMQTIISPLMPSIVKVLQAEAPKSDSETTPVAVAPIVEEPIKVSEPEHNRNLGAFILIGILTGLFVIAGLGTLSLFKSEPVVAAATVDTSKALSNALDSFSTVKYSFNPNTGQLLLVGHVLTSGDKSQLLYALQGLNFIKNLDDSGVIIDEYVWRETNQVLEKNPAWKSINVMATTPGHFVVSGYLQTRAQADRLSEYLSAIFPYPDLLENRTVVEQEIQLSVNTILQSRGLKSVTAKLDNGEVILTGGFPRDKVDDLAGIVNEIKEIRGVRNVRNATTGQAPEQSFVNITDKYEVTGISNQGNRLSVVINGRILMKGDSLDGMLITLIEPSAVHLERDGVRYRIDFNR